MGWTWASAAADSPSRLQLHHPWSQRSHVLYVLFRH